MTSGNLERLDNLRLQAEFSECHADQSCQGSWHMVTKENVPYRFEGLGTVLLVKAPFVACDALFYYPGLEQDLRLRLAERLINDQHALDKKQLRFLRVVAGLTQLETATALNMDMKAYETFESITNTTHQLCIDRQFRLRVIYAHRLGLDLAELGRVADQLDPDEPVHLPQRIESDVEWLKRLAL